MRDRKSWPFDKIEGWASALSETGLSEVEVEEEGVRVRLVRAEAASPAAPAPAGPASTGGSASPPKPPAARKAHGADMPGRTYVTSPRVGVFRRAAPRGRPLAAGDEVRAGEVLGEVSVLDVPYEVTAPCTSRVREVLVEDGLGVEYGQPLIVLEDGV